MSNIEQELRAWLDETWDPDASLVEWRDKLADSGWGQPSGNSTRNDV